MMENKYDEPVFFEKYGKMARSRAGLEAAGEWPALKRLLPNFTGLDVLDLGCGYGWHCRYAAEQGAARVVGVDISQRMLAEARRRTDSPVVEYLPLPIEEIDFAPGSFDAVISSLAFHYVEPFAEVCRRVAGCLRAGGAFVFSAEHPVFTAEGGQGWATGAAGEKLHWPVDRYFEEGPRTAVFLGERVVKFHRTLTTLLADVQGAGFELTAVVEPQPTGEMRRQAPELREELRRPMMLIVSARRAGAAE